MVFDIVRAVPEDVPELAYIMETVAAGMNHPEWFFQDDLKYIQEHVGSRPVSAQDKGFVLKAVTLDEQGKVRIAGFFMVAFPGLTEKNLGHHIALAKEDLLRVAHMDSVVILPEFRGHGLQVQLMGRAEEVIKQETDYRILMATVHPDNTYSLSNVQARGYEIVAEAMKYGGYRRYILKKEI